MIILHKCLCDTIQCYNGKLFGLVGGRRILLANCSPVIKVWKNTTKIPILRDGSQIKEYKISVVFCDDELKQYCSFDELSKILSFELVTEAYHEDGEYTVMLDLKDMGQADIELYGEWSFELGIVGTKELLKKLGMSF